jgi:peroxiredoxin
MLKRAGKIFLTALLAVLTSSALWAQTEGSNAPEIALKDVSGKYVSIIGLRGSVIILNFWATWCPPCREEIPRLEKLYKEYRAKGLVVLGVSGDDEGTIKDFASSHSVQYPLLADPGMRAHKLYHISFVPTTFVIDRNGVIRKKIPGELSEADLRKTLQELLK